MKKTDTRYHCRTPDGSLVNAKFANFTFTLPERTAACLATATVPEPAITAPTDHENNETTNTETPTIPAPMGKAGSVKATDGEGAPMTVVEESGPAFSENDHANI